MLLYLACQLSFMYQSVLVLLVVCPLFFSAQKNCGNPTYSSKRLAVEPNFRKNSASIEEQTEDYVQRSQKTVSGATVTLPVVFHVVYNTAAQNISDAKLLEQLQVLNQDFRKLNSGVALVPQVWQGLVADCEINFCLAVRNPQNVSTSGIERRQTAVTIFGQDDNVKSYAAGGLDAWDSRYYINIWVCNMPAGLYGYTALPGGDALKDGIVLNYRVVGKNGPLAGADSGHTATHEMGHYFNLRHIWADDSGCDSSDFVGDTPNQSVSTLGCATFPKTDACSPSAPGVMFMNFMDYSDDVCLNMFTQGQKTRMWALLDPQTGWRKTLLTSQGCNPVIGINERNETSAVRVYQTAQRGVYKLDFLPEGANLACYDLCGREVALRYTPSDNTIDISCLAQGIYMLKLKHEGGDLFVAKLLNGF